MATKTSKPAKLTPAMQQFQRFKEQFPDCILFFRMGDFYELFYDDATTAHKVMGVTLTQRTEGVPMAGVPYHSVDGYLRKMIQAGFRVAVCDQVEDPAKAKGVVKRDVTRVITPGTLTDESLLEEGLENPLAAVMFHNDDEASLAWTELSTGAFAVTSLPVAQLRDEVARVNPSELIYVELADGQMPQRVKELTEQIGCIGTARPGWQFRQGEAYGALCKQYQVKTLSGFGLEEDSPEVGPAGAIVFYLLETQCADAEQQPGEQQNKTLAHLQPPRRFAQAEHLIVDQVSLRSLEVERTMRSGGTEGSLLGVLQDCVTAMGKRQLRHWLCYPLRRRETIEARQRLVRSFVDDQRFMEQLRSALDDVQDIQRIASRIAVGRATPRDLVGLGNSTAQVDALANLLAERPTCSDYHAQLVQIGESLTGLSQHITQACIESPPAHMREGGLVRDGYDAELDEYRALQTDSNTWLAGYQKQLIDDTGITSLKVGYNKVFGFYIELSAANRDKAPTAWTRKQTLKNAERFITDELKQYEGKVLSAQERAVAREQAIFAQLCDDAAKQLPALHAFAHAVADLDVLACFAQRAVRYRYVQPTIVDEPVMQIAAGRHPVLDELLSDQFVPNDVELGANATLALITGPNMAGKSTYIRQTALITLLAHTGSFVPAEKATIGLCDRIFTRIGASDELHAGQSTFMVEMTETANICHHATPNSLVILDEIGRGTSTLDGLSLAWAIAEHLTARRCRTLFATHYHEITQLADQYDNVTNLNVSVREWQDQIVFLHRIVPGATDRSYGTHVAKIAGLPPSVIERANDLIAQLEVSHTAPVAATPPAARQPEAQMSLFTEYLDHPVVEKLRKAEIDAMTPLQAFDLLRQLRDEAK